MTAHFVDSLKDNRYRVIDGDTVEVTLDRGWKEVKVVSARIYGIDTPENKRTKAGGELEKKAGDLVRQVVEKWLADHSGKQIYHASMSRPKYAFRTIARLSAGYPHFDGSDNDLSDYLLHNGLGKPYKGKAKEPWKVVELEAIIARSEEILA